MKQTIVFDFDGVINSYKHGWQGVSTISDPPVSGIKEEIARIRKKYRVVVVSTRATQPAGKKAIEDYLHKYNIEVDDIVGHKVAGIAYIDDRAIPFKGKAEGLLEEIELLTPWHEEVKVQKGSKLNGN